MAGGMIHMIPGGTYYGVVIKHKERFDIEIWAPGGDMWKSIKGLPNEATSKRVMDDKLKEAEECAKTKSLLPDNPSK